MKRNGMFNRSEFLLTWSDHYSAPVQYDNEILMLLENDREASIVCSFLAYKKKEDFMFNVCMNEKQTKEQQAEVWDNLRLDERSGKEFELLETSWAYEGTLHQMQLSARERLTMLRAFIPYCKEFLKSGFPGTPIDPPYKDLMAVAYPHGLKVKTDMTTYSADKGKEQRNILSVGRLGLSPSKECGWSFNKWDAEGKLQPL